MDKIKHKVIFPYQLCDGKAFLIDENVMTHKYPMTYKYLESQRDELARRDKGKGKDYPVWYAYGRTQSLVMPSIKLFFPKIANIVANSKPYSSGYYSLNGANIKNFGIPIFTEKEVEELLSIQNKDDINNWLARYYS